MSEECNNEREDQRSGGGGEVAGEGRTEGGREVQEERDLSSRVAAPFNPRIHDVSQILAGLAT